MSRLQYKWPASDVPGERKMARVEVKVVKVLRDNYVYMLNHRAAAARAWVWLLNPKFAGQLD